MSVNGQFLPPLIAADNVRLAYGPRTILDEVRLEVRPGEFWFFVGPNGTGKTTLLNAILGLLAPAGGALHRTIPREEIGFVPQRCDFNPALPTTVREFVLLGLVGIRADRKEREHRLAWALERVRLRGLERHDYWSLSGGQRQAALVARALVRRPRLLLADEPVNSLDAVAQTDLLGLLAELREAEQLTLILIAHDLNITARYASHVALFYDGRVVAGPRRTVLVPAHLERVYPLSPCIHDLLGNPPMSEPILAGRSA